MRRERYAHTLEALWPPRRAIMEASRCLYCHDAPCTLACPAGIDVAEFIHRIKSLNYRGAARIIEENNVLGGSCGLVCPVEELCVAACSRTELEVPIRIGELQRFAWEMGRRDERPHRGRRGSGSRVAVIGGGPSGLAAAAELAELGHGVVIFEADEEPGGLLRWGIPLHRLSPEILQGEIASIERRGVEVRCGVALGQGYTLADLKEEGFSALFLGVGLSQPVRLDIPGNDLSGVYRAVEILRHLRRGDRLELGRRVAVIGGGNVALDAALTARRLGALRVEVVCLEAPDEMPAFWSEVDLAWREGVEFHTRSMPLRALGTKAVQGMEGIGMEWREPGNMAPSNAVPIPGTEFTLKVDAIIEAVGQRFDRVVAQALDLEVDQRGLVRVDHRGQTTNQMIFAGGDCVNGGATVVQAVAEGKRGARGMDDWLRE